MENGRNKFLLPPLLKGVKGIPRKGARLRNKPVWKKEKEKGKSTTLSPKVNFGEF